MLLPSRPLASRHGLSLLEVLVALAIFLLSFVAIGRLVTLASDHALDIQQQSQATRLAQSKLNEVIAGIESLQGGSGSFEEDPGWQWTVEAEQSSDVPNLWTVTVTVTHPGEEGNDVTATLSQMVMDPSIRGSVFDQITVTGSTDTAPANTGSTPSQSGTGAAGGQGAAAGGAAAAGKSGSKPATGGASMGGGSLGGRGGNTGGRGGGSNTGGNNGGNNGGGRGGGGAGAGGAGGRGGGGAGGAGAGGAGRGG
jgi:type II secretion system protein I